MIRVDVMQIHCPLLNVFIPLFIAIWVPVAHSAEPMVFRVDLSKTDGTWNMPALALAMKPPALFPEVNHFKVHPNDYGE